MAMIIDRAELTDRDENGFQQVILWHKSGIPLVTLKVDSFQPEMPMAHRETVMCDLLDVLQDGVKFKEGQSDV